jgi:hypothetical protein
MWLSVNQAAREYDVSSKVIYYWISKKIINAKCVARNTTIEIDEAFLARVNATRKKRFLAPARRQQQLARQQRQQEMQLVASLRVADPKVIDFAALKNKEAEILRFVIDYKVEHCGQSPSLREICKGAGVSSTSVVLFNLSNLADIGYIRMTGDGNTRGIFLLGESYLPPQTIDSRQESDGEI